MGTLWIWHVPELYEAVLAVLAVHTAEHASFLFSTMLFWWVPAGLVYAAAMLVLFLAWLCRADRVANRR